MNLHVVQFQYIFWVARTHVSSIKTDLPRQHRRESLTQTIELHPIFVSNSRIFSSWRVTENKPQHPLLESVRRSWRRSVFLVETGPPSGFLFHETDLLLELSEQRQSSRPASQNFGKFFQKRIAMTSIPPMNQPSPLLRSITLLPMENQNRYSLEFWIVFSTPKMIVDEGTCRIAIPFFAVFAVRPCSSVEYPPVL